MRSLLVAPPDLVADGTSYLFIDTGTEVQQHLFSWDRLKRDFIFSLYSRSLSCSADCFYQCRILSLVEIIQGNTIEHSFYNSMAVYDEHPWKLVLDVHDGTGCVRVIVSKLEHIEQLLGGPPSPQSMHTWNRTAFWRMQWTVEPRESGINVQPLILSRSENIKFLANAHDLFIVGLLELQGIGM